MFIRIRLIPITIVFVILMLVFRIGSVWHGIDTAQTARAIPNIPAIDDGVAENILLSNETVSLNIQNDSSAFETNKIADLGGFISDVRAQNVNENAGNTIIPETVDLADIPAREDPNTRGLTPLSLVNEDVADKTLINTNSLSVAEVRLLHTLADRRRQLESRERSLTERETVLIAAERQLIIQQDELESIRDAIRTDLTTYDELQQKQIIQMRAVYSAMKPKKAAKIFNDLDHDILVNVLRGMTARKIAPIISEMNVEKARNITLTLADRNSYALPE